MSQPSAHDVCVIGGGVTGAGVARDLSLRGLSVLLLEKGDWGAGTSGASSWMIHGGPRYLEFDWDTTRHLDQGRGLHRDHRAQHRLPRRLHHPDPSARQEQHRTDGDGDGGVRPLPAAEEGAPARAPDGGRGAAGRARPDHRAHRRGDAWRSGASIRTGWSTPTCEDAVAHGARALNHTRVIELLRDGGKVIGVRYRAADGALSEARARVVVNATGPWSPQISEMAGAEVQLRPAKGIHLVYPHRISNFSISAEIVDGRDLLMVSHGGFTLLGTTDDDFYGDLDSVDVLEDEVDYLLQAFERVFPVDQGLPAGPHDDRRAADAVQVEALRGRAVAALRGDRPRDRRASTDSSPSPAASCRCTG